MWSVDADYGGEKDDNDRQRAALVDDRDVDEAHAVDDRGVVSHVFLPITSRINVFLLFHFIIYSSHCYYSEEAPQHSH